MRTELLDYELPERLIAKRPPPERDGARMLVVPPDGALRHARVRDFCELVPAGALLVLNDTRVRKCRLLGHKPSGGKVELLLVRRLELEPGGEERWSCLGRSNKPLKPGSELDFGPLRAQVLARCPDGTLECRVRAAGEPLEAWLEKIGRVPIPPYLGRDDDDLDVERYQTLFARRLGSAAAPTAGLHLSERMLERLREREVEIGWLTLHVGLGTFQPVSAADLDQHAMHAESFRVEADLAGSVARARERGAPVVAVGTTVVRALESAADPERPGAVRPMSGETRLLIQPGHRFRVVDALLTNFHAPKSTLLALVAAFASLPRLCDAYAAAVREEYRFLSYGDAMWLPGRAP